jgi:hypothetical protein
VSLERGEITVLSGERMPLEAAEGPPTERRRFSVDWRTRYEWDSGEREQLAALQRELAEQDALRQAQAEKKGAAAKPGVPAPKAAPPAKAPAPAAKPAPPAKAESPAAEKPAAAAAKPAAPPAAAAKAETPAAHKPAAPAGKPAAPAAPAGATPPSAAKPAAPRAVAAPAAPQAPRLPASPGPPPAPPAAPPVASPPAPAAASPAKSEPAPTGRIVELRLSGGGFDLVARETGAHDMGRAKDAALRIDNQTVSRQHARIIISDDRTVAYVQDRGGANGTLLNGSPVDKLKLVKEGDVIGLGEIKLKVSIRRE